MVIRSILCASLALTAMLLISCGGGGKTPRTTAQVDLEAELYDEASDDADTVAPANTLPDPVVNNNAVKMREMLDSVDHSKIVIHGVDPDCRGDQIPKGTKDFYKFAIIETLPNVTPEQFAPVASVLRRDNAYNDDHANCFNPGMGIEIGSGDAKLDLLVCLACDKVKYFYKGQSDIFALGDQAVTDLFADYYVLFPKAKDADAAEEDAEATETVRRVEALISKFAD